jgi:hypothetical protein
MGENAGVVITRRAAMFGAAMIATAVAGNTPVGAAYDVDTNGDGTPDALEISVEKKSHSLAKDLASLHGGNWAVSMDHQFITIFKISAS